MSDRVEKAPGIVEGEIVDSIKPIDFIIPRPEESEEQFEARIKKEKAFLKLQREIAQFIIGEERAKDVEDFYEANIPTGISAVVFGKNFGGVIK